MNKAKVKCRDIQFFSKKNNQMVCVHSREEREYARMLEEDSNVAFYEAGTELDRSRYSFVNPIGIRKSYFDTDWATDFVLQYEDGRIGVRELVSASALEKQAAIEKLEFSRRYWANSEASEWKVLIMEKGGRENVL